jgi:hypothetical protein
MQELLASALHRGCFSVLVLNGGSAPMKSIIRRWQELTVRNASCLSIGLAIGLACAGCASDPASMAVGQPIALPTLNEYCAVAQKEVASSRVPARNVVITDYQAFSRASPQVKPLETMQFVTYADAQHSKPRMISCKLHSVERIRAEYGPTAAGEPTSCARLNRRTLDAVMGSLTERQKKKMPFKGAVPVMLEPDLQSASETEWLEEFTMVQTDAGGTLRIRAKSLGVGSGGTRVSTRSAAGGGKQYCHLIAPDYLRRVLLGEVPLPKAGFQDASQTVSQSVRR